MFYISKQPMEVKDRIEQWRKFRLRGSSQINVDVAVLWYQRWLQIFEKELLDYASWKLNTADRVQNITANQNEYTLPLWVTNVEDFYSIINLQVAYKTNKNGIPIYHQCEAINIGDYNTLPAWTEHPWYQVWAPIVKNVISKRSPKYCFVNKNTIKIFPTPTENVTAGLRMIYNYMPKEVSKTTDESTLNLPRYFFDAIEDYMTYCLIETEHPDLAAPYLAAFNETIHRNIYWLNRDQREIEENFANLAYYRIW